ncbi:MAG: hypothetical protein J3Q66DRAFT_363320 [Benniella sp.]|nr:MAG: hypothetical protein J3Q66DRAFT_363320 [Benniella sp.]
MRKDYEYKQFQVDNDTMRDPMSGGIMDSHNSNPPHSSFRPGIPLTALGSRMGRHNNYDQELDKLLEILSVKRNMEQQKSMDEMEERMRSLVHAVLNATQEQAEKFEKFSTNSQKHIEAIKEEAVEVQEEEVERTPTDGNSTPSRRSRKGVQELLRSMQEQLQDLDNQMDETTRKMLADTIQDKFGRQKGEILGSIQTQLESWLPFKKQLLEQQQDIKSMNTESNKLHGDSHNQLASIQKQLTDQQQGIEKIYSESDKFHGESRERMAYGGPNNDLVLIQKQLTDQLEDIKSMNAESNKFYGDSHSRLDFIQKQLLEQQDIKSINTRLDFIQKQLLEQQQDIKNMNTESDKFHGDSRGQFALIQKQLTDQQQGIDKMNGDSLTVIQDDLKQLAVIRGDLKSHQQMTEKSLEAIRLNVVQQQLNTEKMIIENHQSHQELTIMHIQLHSLHPEELRVILTEIQGYTRTVIELLEKHMSKGRCHSQPSTTEQTDSAPDSRPTDDRGLEETPDRPRLEDVPREESSDRDTPRGCDQDIDPMLDHESQPTDVPDPEPPKTQERKNVEIPDDISEGNSDSTAEVTKKRDETEPEEPTKVEPETMTDVPQDLSRQR